jgi:L-alanine-DL-glutamate epimerase-like enolase superfamily enzyme
MFRSIGFSSGATAWTRGLNRPADVTLASTRLRSVEIIPIGIPLDVPTRISTRTLTRREYVVVRVADGTGVVGTGYTYVGTTGALAMARFIADVIEPILVGAPAYGPARPWQAVYREILLLGRRGLALRAMSAVDIALWDLLGQTLGVPLYLLLGGIRDAVPAYASGGYYRSGDALENVAAEMERYKARGFTDFKIKVGGAPFAVDVERVRVARETIGPDARLALDANNAWRFVDDAVRFGRAVEPFQPWWLEEPLPPDDLPGHAQVARQLSIPVALGEIHATRWDFRDMFAERVFSIVQPDAGVVGGISEWLTVAHTAETFSVAVAPHWNANVHVHLAGAVDGCLTVEYFAPEEDIFNFERLVADPLAPTNGLIPIPDRPGLGIVFDKNAIQRFRL